MVCLLANSVTWLDEANIANKKFLQVASRSSISAPSVYYVTSEQSNKDETSGNMEIGKTTDQAT
jgi:hypothetical protein